MPNDTPSPGSAYHKWIKDVYPCIGMTIKDKFAKEVVRYPSGYRITRARLKDSSWLESTVFISSGNGDPRGRLVIWRKDGTGLVYDAVPSYEVGRLHGFSRKPKEKSVEELEAEHMNDLKRSLAP